MSEDPRLRRSEWIVGAAGLATLAALFWVFRIWLPGNISVTLRASDVFLYYLPIYELLYGSLLSGRLPIWNPYQLCGIPVLASLQAGFFYPGHLPYLLLPVKVAFGVSGIAHLTLVAVSMALLVRRLGLGIPAALAAAVLLALRGRYPGMVFFPNMLEAAAWLPLGAIAVLSIVRGGGRRDSVLLALCTGASLLAGYPQMSVYVVYAWGALLVLFGLAESLRPAAWPRAIGFFALGLALGVGLASIQLVPGLELTGQGTHSPGPLSQDQQFPFGWAGLTSGLRDALVGTLRAPFPVLSLSLGAGALVLLPLAFFAKGRRLLALGSLAVAALVLLFAMGPATPFFDWIVKLPALGWFRFPRRALFMLDFFLVLALAVCVHAVAQRVAAAARGSSAARFAPLIACGLVVLAVTWLGAPDGAPAPALFALAVAGLVAVAFLGAPPVGRAAWVPPFLLVALLVLEFFSAEPNRQKLYFVPGRMEVYRAPREIYERISASGDRAWIRSVGINPPLPPKLASYFRMRSIGDYEPLNLRRQAEYFTYLMEGQLTPTRQGQPYSGRLRHLTAPTYPGALAERGQLLDVAAVRWVVASRREVMRGELAEYIASRGLEAKDVADPDFVLLENPRAAPRAYVVYDVRPAPEPLALMQAMSQPDFDPLVMSYVEGASSPVSPGPRGHAARIVRDEETVVEIEADLASAGTLVFVDSFYSGWRATVDGRELEIRAANHLFRSVELPAGRHVVRFDYRPWTLTAGGGISAAAFLTLFVLGSRRRPTDELRDPPSGDSIANRDG